MCVCARGCEHACAVRFCAQRLYSVRVSIGFIPADSWRFEGETLSKKATFFTWSPDLSKDLFDISGNTEHISTSDESLKSDKFCLPFCCP